MNHGHRNRQGAVEPLVDIKMEDHIAWIFLNRPNSLNAINRPLLKFLDDAVATVESDSSIRVGVISGRGRAFCAGGDLKSFLAPDGFVDTPGVMDLIRCAGKVFDRISECSKPMIAAVNGVAFAGGLELALACDLIIAAASARMGDGHANYGLVQGGGGAARLVRVVGPTVAKYMSFTGDSVPAENLATLGLVNEVVADEQLTSRVNSVAKRITEKSASGIAHMKRLINESADQELAVALKAEHLALAKQLMSGDAQEGLSAFRDRRKPRFDAVAE